MPLNKIDQVYIKHDDKTGLFAAIAIHDERNNPALGGCRCIHYDSEDDAIKDAINLAQTMSYKTAIAGVPFGGGKAVLMKPRVEYNRLAYFKSFGEFVEELEGKFITGCDSGVTQEDMRIASNYTSYMTAIPLGNQSNDYLIKLTGDGVLKSIEVALRKKLRKSNVKGLKIAIQGLGKVGYYIAHQLSSLGCHLIATDLDTNLTEKAKKELGVKIVAPDDIYKSDCDIFIPCGLGGIINGTTVAQFNASIICGAANNQIETPEIGQKLLDRGIIYIPDFVANVGGTIFAAGSYQGINYPKIEQYALKRIKGLILTILEISELEKKPTNIVALDLAYKIKTNLYRNSESASYENNWII